MILHQILFIYFQTSQKSITIINKIFEKQYQYTSKFPPTIESQIGHDENSIKLD